MQSPDPSSERRATSALLRVISEAHHLHTIPLRLLPASDLRREIEQAVAALPERSAFVLSGIGSLTQANLRFAAAESSSLWVEPFEVLSLAGSVTPEGAHLHASVSSAAGHVLGGHLGYGCLVRTTAEVLVAVLPEWKLSREHDPASGYKELTIARRSGSDVATSAVRDVNASAAVSTDEDLRMLERTRLRALVGRDFGLARALHSSEFHLITPRGASYSRESYLQAVEDGRIVYLKWEAVGILVRRFGNVALLRYRAELAMPGPSGEPESFECWHTDSYELHNGFWQVVWSQATRIR